MPGVVLVTGVGRHLGSRVAARLAADDRWDRVIGVDTVAPRGPQVADLGRTEFVRADIRNPLIAKVVAGAAVDTVLHMNVMATPHSVGGRTAMKEMNVLGTLQLLAACQQAPSVRRLVVKSSTVVYGSSPSDPALFTEDTEPRTPPASGYGKDAVEVETYVRGFARRRPDVSVTLLRLANVLSASLDTPMTRYLSLPVVPTAIGFDPRVQFLHGSDALDALEVAVRADRSGTYNVAGPGVLLLSQALRRAGRLPLPVPQVTTSTLGLLLRRTGAVDFSPEQVRFLSYGRVVDTSRIETELGFRPRLSTVDALDDFVRGRDLSGLLVPDRVAGLEQALLRRLIRPVAAGSGRG